MSRKLLAILTIALTLPGCASMADGMSKAAGMGVVKQQISTFDNATIITATPTTLWAKGSWGNQVHMGARWNSAEPAEVALLLSYSSNVSSSYGSPYMGLEGIEINVDGDISSFTAAGSTRLDHSGYNTVSKTIYTSSDNAVVIPYSLLERMVSARDCRLRIHTSKGYEDAQFSIERIPGGQGTAILPIRELMQKVAVFRAQH